MATSQGSATGNSQYRDSPGPEIGDEVFPDPNGFDNGRSGGQEELNVQSEAEKILAARAADPTNFTARGVAIGLVIGVVICFSNVYFGLQTGWISGMTMPSALISFGFFKALSPYLKVQFSPMENVLVQSVAGSVGAMPLGCGFVGVMPALEFLLKPEENGPLNLSLWTLCMWAVGVCLFGVVIAVPLRRQVIIREKLKFPSGSATALMIGVLHGDKEEASLIKQNSQTQENNDEQPHDRTLENGVDHAQDHASQAELLEGLLPNPALGGSFDWKAKIRIMLLAFLGSAVYTIISYFFPQLHNIPIFGLPLARTWLWAFNPSPAYIGQGIIMGSATTIHMLLGAIVGWAVLSPLSKHQGWAPGPVSDWETGGKGWIVWISLAIMLADAVVSLGWLVVQPLLNYFARRSPGIWANLRSRNWSAFLDNLNPFSNRRSGYTAINRTSESTPRISADDQQTFQQNHITNTSLRKVLTPTQASSTPELDAPPNYQISTRIFVIGLLTSFALYFATIHLSFPSIIDFPSSLLALIFSLLLSVMGVRALGSTDLNPVSGISKLTQLAFSLLPMSSPSLNKNAIPLNLLAGAVSESAALQAGDLMQDLKTGHLLGASPKAQFWGQIIGSLVGSVVAACVYRLYTNVYTIPSGQFQTPTAFVWINTARLLTGQGLPPRAAEAAGIAAAIYAVLTAIRVVGQSNGKGWINYIPGGIAVAVGMYNTPSFTLARTLGGLISWYWVSWRKREESGVVVIASGLILGEGLISIVNLVMESLGVPHL